jgi:hypothetical protein
MKMKRKKRRYGLCAYCGENKEITDDHIPPKNLFSKPRPSNLITVPSCLDCNRGMSKDDEYFRLNLVLRENVPQSPEGEQLFQSILRGFFRPESKRFKNELFSRIGETELIIEPNIYIGKSPAYDVDLNRLTNVTNRIIKGLFFYETKERVSDEYEVKSFAVSGFQPSAYEKVKKIIDILICRPAKYIGKKEIFTYWHFQAEDNPSITVWLLLFFKTTSFLGFTIPV